MTSGAPLDGSAGTTPIPVGGAANPEIAPETAPVPSQQLGGGAPDTSFPRASRKQLGYRTADVDQFLLQARRTYEGDPSLTTPVTSQEVRRTAFPVHRRGYSARFVDAAMDRLEEVFFERERRERIREIGEDAWWADTQQLLSEVKGRLQRDRGRRFRRRGLLTTGYRISEVDAFLDRITAMFEGNETVSSMDVRSAVFHSQWRGYDEDQVDALLDSVVVLLLATR